jgi:hypothetical protein
MSVICRTHPPGNIRGLPAAFPGLKREQPVRFDVIAYCRRENIPVASLDKFAGPEP